MQAVNYEKSSVKHLLLNKNYCEGKLASQFEDIVLILKPID